MTGILTISQVARRRFAGYAFARIAFPLKNLLFGAYLATLIIPNQVTMPPLFLLVAASAGSTPTGAHRPCPRQRVRGSSSCASSSDHPARARGGAPSTGRAGSGVLPDRPPPRPARRCRPSRCSSSSASGTTTLWPSSRPTPKLMRTLLIGLRFFVEESGSQLHLMMAGAVMAVVPILLLFFMAQKQFIEGIAMTGSKG
ncbi:MAG: hypothetical protein M5U09_05330 [Gammaproteobacteria bacterium]|nr:hypothetical protein [Gammaproteobacteria bacterium]